MLGQGSGGRWAVFPAAGLLFAVQLALYRDYLTDDSYIYARFARNLAERGELAFNPGQPIHAATSPLWAGLGAIGVWMGLDAFTTLKLVGMVLGLVATLLFTRVARRDLPRGAPWAFLAAGILATEPWLVRWSASGMESAFAALVIAALLDQGWRPDDRVHWGRLGWIAGIGPLVRPELLLLSALIAVHVLRTPSASRSGGLWLGLFAPLLLWTAFALPIFGHVLPTTLEAKSTPLGLIPSRLLANVLVLVQILVVGAFVPVLAAILSWRPLRSWNRDSTAWIVPVLWQWVALLPLVYLLRDVQVVSRYLLVILSPMILLGLRAMARWRRPRLLQVFMGAQIVFSLVLTTVWISPNVRAFSLSMDRGLGDLAAWIRENTPPDALVAIYDIGIVGYRSERRVLDLGGLVEPAINQMRNQVDDAEILRRGLFLRVGRPDVLIDRDPVADALDGHRFDGLQARAILHREIANLGLSRAQPVIYTLYRLESAPR